MNGRVLIIAGSDSGGGAGIQADIKTVTALGGYAATAVTALTAQNTRGVFGILPVPPDFVRQQMELVLSDIGADAVKVGMLGSAAMAAAVADALGRHGRRASIVVDPVMVAKGGASLADEATRAVLREVLLPVAAVVTPNAPEAQALTGVVIDGLDAMRLAADRLLMSGAGAVLVKGGHLEGDVVVDLLRTGDGEEHVFESPRVSSRSTHGTGCTLASAIATGVAQGLTLRHAVDRARRYVHAAIVAAPGLGGGHGPLNHAHAIAEYL